MSHGNTVACRYNDRFTPNASDSGGRYRFAAQQNVAQWNIAALASLFTATVSVDKLQSIVNEFAHMYKQEYVDFMKRKLGLVHTAAADVDSLVCPCESCWFCVNSPHLLCVAAA